MRRRALHVQERRATEPPSTTTERRDTSRLKLVRLAAVAGAIVVGMAIAELGIRWLAPQDLRVACRSLNERNYFTNRKSASARHEQGARRLTYRFNELGLRGGPVGDEPVRVLFLGDSFTFGYLLEEPRTYVGILRTLADRELPRGVFQLLNGGVEGWGAADYVAFVEDYGAMVKPTVVAVFLSYDDIRRAARSGLYAMPQADSLRLEPRVRELDARLRMKRLLDRIGIYYWLVEQSHLLRLIRNSVAPVRAFQDRQVLHEPEAGQATGVARDWSQEVNLGRALFRRLRTVCERQGVTLLVLTTGYQRKSFEMYPGTPDQAFFEQADRMFHEEGIPYHNISPEISAEVDGRWHDFILQPGFHPNEAGAELIARHSWPWLKARLEEIGRGAPSDP